ncbi:MAG TPA: chitobiase/beta-hexosaminidase C-terminal domain-containing protein [Burkholderiaceae bacterium]|jgi:hypothetical protein
MSNAYRQSNRTLLFAIIAAFFLLLSTRLHAQSASDFTASVLNNNGVVTLQFQSNVNTSWVNAHYNVNGGAQLNVAMTQSGSTPHFQTTVAANAGDTVNFSFTYNNGSPAYDSAWSSAMVPPSGPPPAATPVFSPASGNYSSAQSVTLSDATSGAALYYTTDGSTPTTASARYTAPITVSASTTTIRAIATASGMSNSGVVSAVYTIGTISGPYTQGVIDNGTTVTIWFTPNPSSGLAIVHYTANNGAQQNVNMALVNGQWTQSIPATSGAPFTVSYSFTYQLSNGTQSTTPSYTWARGSQAATPVISPNGGSFTAPQTVTLSDTTSGAAIHYTTDGTTPSSASTLYAAPFSISSNGTVKAIAIASGMANSAVSNASFTITQAQIATPAISPAGGSFSSAQSVSLSDATPGAAIYYTTNGSTPTTASTLYSGPFTVSSSSTVKAIAAASAMTSSNLASATFSITTPQVATPTISPAGGSFTSAQSVTLADTTSGATIYYTVDGTAPTTASTRYAGPFNLSASATVNAIATAPGISPSQLATATFTINCANCFSFIQGVIQSASGAQIWFASTPVETSAPTIGYFATLNGVNTVQQNVTMTWNAATGRWLSPVITPTSPGEVVSYDFTYFSPAVNGNLNSPTPPGMYTYTICNPTGTPACSVPEPSISPAGGAYASPQTVTLTPAPGSTSGTSIYYTVDGTYPNLSSANYAGPIALSNDATINAIEVLPSGAQSLNATASYHFTGGGCTSGCPVLAPTFSLPSGTYPTAIGINLLTMTTGAVVHYTIDGSVPTDSSPEYRGTIWLSAGTTGAATTINALATLDGINSAIVSNTYHPGNGGSTWNGMTTFNIVNGTNGTNGSYTYADSQIYWFLIGMNAAGQFVHVTVPPGSVCTVAKPCAGTLTPMQMSDDTIPEPSMGVGIKYANYSYPLSQVASITIPAITSARLYMSVGQPVLVQAQASGYAGPSIENPNDPNMGVIFDMGELNINPPGANAGIWVDTSRVDMFGFPIKLNVTGLDGFNSTTGESLLETRAQLFSLYQLGVPAAFQSLGQIQAPQRIVAPADGTFNNQINVATGQPTGALPGPNAAYLDAYIASVWQQYETQPLTINLADGTSYTGQVAGNVFTFVDGAGISYPINLPTTTDVLLGDGALNNPNGWPVPAPGQPPVPGYAHQLQLETQLCAALNRGVAHLPFSQWYTSADFYPAAPRVSNSFSQFWHRHALNALTYGFAYDDAGSFSSTIYTPSPVSVTFTIGQ